ncbi:hypothetical protein MTR67_019811 [Solanum verrucosum]|uniref:Plastocyanin-like domain-containing protein n=1 Tax=Solanum verrucosum TaxID=315347 RepID=A0AAF0QTL0_SOLVR|nr:hypothetical protein MTR67_019811 [Solanum verrucosum]
MTFQKINTSLVLIIFFAVQYTGSTQNNNNIHFVIEETSFDRLCQSKKILTVNGRFPGPTIYARAGETLALDVENRGKDNVTMFCCRGVGKHVKFDQVEWLVEAGSTVRKNITISDDDEGTLWWHAMNIWQRATVHGAFIVHLKPGKPDDHADIPIILGEWWKKDVKEVFLDYIDSGSDLKSDAFTVDGQPGDFYPCSKNVVLVGRTVQAAISRTFSGCKLALPWSDLCQNIINLQPTLRILLVCWQKPDSWYLKVNTDESFNMNDGRAGLGGALRYEHGELIMEFSIAVQ